jgi:hypothetical protein
METISEASNEPLLVATEPLTDKAKAITRKEYMRKYMKERYDREGDKARAYSKTLKAKAKHNLTQDDYIAYGIYLGDVFKIRELVKKLPSEVWTKCFTEIQAH